MRVVLCCGLSMILTKFKHRPSLVTCNKNLLISYVKRNPPSDSVCEGQDYQCNSKRWNFRITAVSLSVTLCYTSNRVLTVIKGLYAWYLKKKKKRERDFTGSSSLCMKFFRKSFKITSRQHLTGSQCAKIDNTVTTHWHHCCMNSTSVAHLRLPQFHKDNWGFPEAVKCLSFFSLQHNIKENLGIACIVEIQQTYSKCKTTQYSVFSPSLNHPYLFNHNLSSTSNITQL